jgi:crotonobetainyl-CoA:carnitine CoA-transferase CaiB-like acyl-CoA transferase
VKLPLPDFRILAIEQFGDVPWATLQLADLATAEVVKIEDPSVLDDVALAGRSQGSPNRVCHWVLGGDAAR